MTTFIKILVQGSSEPASDFAIRIENEILDFQKKIEFKTEKDNAPIVSFTSSSDGRQTANIVFNPYQL
jgi:hypothetical protein